MALGAMEAAWTHTSTTMWLQDGSKLTEVDTTFKFLEIQQLPAPTWWRRLSSSCTVESIPTNRITSWCGNLWLGPESVAEGGENGKPHFLPSHIHRKRCLRRATVVTRYSYQPVHGLFVLQPCRRRYKSLWTGRELLFFNFPLVNLYFIQVTTSNLISTPTVLLHLVFFLGPITT